MTTTPAPTTLPQGTPAPKTRIAPTDITTALAAALTAERMAAYSYGVAGARLSSSRARSAALAGLDSHRTRRDAIAALLTERSEALPPDPGLYQLPAGAPTGESSARELLAALEQVCAATFADLVGLADGSALRASAASWLNSSAVAAAIWSGSTGPWPGLPERS